MPSSSNSSYLASDDDPSGAARERARAYRFCMKCWLPVAPVFSCTCPVPPPDDKTLAAIAIEYPGLVALQDAIAAGRYSQDRGTLHTQSLAFLRWLIHEGRLTGDTSPDYETAAEEELTRYAESFPSPGDPA